MALIILLPLLSRSLARSQSNRDASRPQRSHTGAVSVGCACQEDDGTVREEPWRSTTAVSRTVRSAGMVDSKQRAAWLSSRYLAPPRRWSHAEVGIRSLTRNRTSRRECEGTRRCDARTARPRAVGLYGRESSGWPVGLCRPTPHRGRLWSLHDQRGPAAVGDRRIGAKTKPPFSQPSRKAPKHIQRGRAASRFPRAAASPGLLGSPLRVDR